MKLSIIGLMFVLALSGCGLTPANVGTTVDTVLSGPGVQAGIKDACVLADLGHAGFPLIVKAAKLTPKDVSYEAKAYAEVQVVCANPPTDMASAMALVMKFVGELLGQQAAVAK